MFLRNNNKMGLAKFRHQKAASDIVNSCGVIFHSVMLLCLMQLPPSEF
jgi:hypothetical protein